MSQMNTEADLMYSVGADTRALERAMKDTARKTQSAFGEVGETIEKRTAGARKFAGALSSTVGIATGVAGALGFATAAAGGFYAAYEDIAKQAERIAEANERSEKATRNTQQDALLRVGQGDPTRGAMTANTSGITARIEALRLEQEELYKVGGLWNAFSTGMMFLATGQDPQAARLRQIEQEIRSLENTATEVSTLTVDQSRKEARAKIEAAEQELRLLELRARGDEEGLQALEKRMQAEKRVADLRAQADAMRRSPGLTEQANTLDAIADRMQLQNQLLSERLVWDKAITAEQEKRERMMKDQQRADSLEMRMREQMLIAQGDDAALKQLRADRDRAAILKEINELEGISIERRMQLLTMADQVNAAIARGAIGMPEEGQNGPGFGASASGNIGASAGAQVLGGTGGMMQQLDRQRNTALAKIVQNTSDMAVALRDGIGTAVLG